MTKHQTPGLRLPPELIQNIVTQIHDDSTLDTLCETLAEAGYRALCKFVFEQRWKELTINHHRLITRRKQPLETNVRRSTLRSHKTEVTDNELGQLSATVRPTKFGLSPLEHARKFVLNLQICVNEDLSTYQAKYRSMPHIDDLKYTMQILAPHFTALREFNHAGNLPQELLDQFSSILPRHCTKLAIREGYQPRWKFRYDDGRDAGSLSWNDLRLDWSMFGQVHWLRELRIMQLSHDEGSTLAKSIGKLKSLQKLWIGAGSINAVHTKYTNESPLQALLDGMFPSTAGEVLDDYPILPDTLRELTLMDNGWSQASVVVVRAESLPQLCPNLTKLYLELNSLSATVDALSWFDLRTVKQLVVAGNRRLKAWDDILEVADEHGGSYIKHIVSDERFVSLQRVVLLNAYDIHLNSIKALNETRWAMEDLVLGTKHYSFYMPQFPEGRLEYTGHHPWLRNLNGHRKPDIKGRWGARLKRLRIDCLSVTKIDFNGLADVQQLSNLQVLVLYPFPLSNVPESQVQQIAKTIIGQIPSLMVISVAQHSYWIDRKPEGETPHLRPLYTAIYEPELGPRIRQSLQPRDWRFLKLGYLERPLIDLGHQPDEDDGNGFGYLDRMYISHRNYGVLWRGSEGMLWE